MTTTIQTSSLTNSVTMLLNLNLRKFTQNPCGFGDANKVVREHAQAIVEDFQGALLGGWVNPRRAFPTEPRDAAVVEKLTAKILRELHRQSGATGRVDLDETPVRLRIKALVAAFEADWPHRDEHGVPVDINGEPAPLH